MVNFRADRVQQILSALLLKEFENVSRETISVFSATLGMKSYMLDAMMLSLFPQESLKIHWERFWKAMGLHSFARQKQKNMPT